MEIRAFGGQGNSEAAFAAESLVEEESIPRPPGELTRNYVGCRLRRRLWRSRVIPIEREICPMSELLNDHDGLESVAF